nr:cyclophilin A, yCyPA {N-terminal} [Saccharomyces cerevisiae, Peptide Recombinant Partial, 15 aa] [Saccharomyces cerevisiae]
SDVGELIDQDDEVIT